MSDTSDERPRDNYFSRAILARIIAVVLFILLGTATVVYLVKYQRAAKTQGDESKLKLETAEVISPETKDDLDRGGRSPASLYATTPASLEEPTDADSQFTSMPATVAASFPPPGSFDPPASKSTENNPRSVSDSTSSSISPAATNHRFNDLPSLDRPDSNDNAATNREPEPSQPPSFTAPDRYAANFGGLPTAAPKPFTPLPDDVDRFSTANGSDDLQATPNPLVNRGNSTTHPFEAGSNKPLEASPRDSFDPGGFIPAGLDAVATTNPQNRDIPKTIPDLPNQINTFPGTDRPKLKAPAPNAVPQNPPQPLDNANKDADIDHFDTNRNSENNRNIRNVENEREGFTSNPRTTGSDQRPEVFAVADSNRSRSVATDNPTNGVESSLLESRPNLAVTADPSSSPTVNPRAFSNPTFENNSANNQPSSNAPSPFLSSQGEPQPLRSANDQLVESRPSAPANADSSPPGNPTTNRQTLINAPPVTVGSTNDETAIRTGAIPTEVIPTAGLPGERQLEGVQAPALTVEKLAPREIALHQTSNFEIVIRNVGRVDANQVQVHDRVPVNTRFEGSTPEPIRITDDGQILWELGTLAVGREARIQYRLQPTAPGEIGSVAHVTFATQAAMRTRVTQPQLEISHRSNPIVMIGGDVVLDVVVTNRGDGVARNVLIQEDVPEQLEFREGFRELEYEVGTLAPGQARRIQLPLKAVKVGKLKNRIIAVAEGEQRVQHEIDVEVVSPTLKLSLDGPSRRFLNRQATHTLTIVNQGTAAATNVELIAKLPSGLKFVGANNQGRYIPQRHAVFWSMAQLPIGLEGQLELVTMPAEIGQQNIQFEITADHGISAAETQPLVVEHVADIYFDIKNLIDPIEVGAETAFQIRLVNQGTIVAENVRLTAQFDNGLSPATVEGNLQHQISGQTIQFAPIANLKPGEQLQLIIRARGRSPGDHRVVLKLETDGRQASVTKEAATRVYADR